MTDIRVKYTIAEDDVQFTDALYYTPEEFEALSPEDLEAQKQARFQAWKAARVQPDPTKAELVALYEATVDGALSEFDRVTQGLIELETRTQRRARWLVLMDALLDRVARLEHDAEGGLTQTQIENRRAALHTALTNRLES